MTQTERKNKSSDKRLFQRRRPVMWLLWIGAYVLIMLLCITVITPERSDLHVGDIAKKTITASKDVVDEVTTKQRRDYAASQVSAVYYLDETVEDAVVAELNAAFVEMRGVQQYGKSLREQTDSVLRDGEATPKPTEKPQEPQDNDGLAYTEIDLNEAEKKLSRIHLTRSQLTTLMNASTAEMNHLQESLVSGVRTAMASTIAEGQVNDAITNVQELVGYSVPTELWMGVGVPTLRTCLRPNMLIDQDATEANREKARQEIEPVMFKQGQNIVVAGERVTAPQLALLGSLGLLQGTRFDSELYLGIGMLAAIVLVGLYLYLVLFVPDLLNSLSNQTLMLIILLLTLGLCLASVQVNPFLLPIALGVLLATILLGTRTAMGVNVALALLMNILTLRSATSVATNSSQAIGVVLMTVIGGIVASLSVRKRAPRSKVLLSGLYVGFTNAVAVFAAGLATNNDMNIVGMSALFAFISGPVATVLCVGIQPALEVLFNLVTPAKLLELCNPNQPLLRRLMIEAPGTYHHSMVVANIAEAAAEAIGANPLLVRVGAYYHDLGKLKRPIYFKENQTGENPHDHTDPRVSTAILVAHTRDGVALAQRNRMPQRVLDLIAQHHGDTPVLYFYNKAVQLNDGQPVDVADFRYEGPKPLTSEAAILMLADTVEAAVRSIQDATPEKIESTIRRLIKTKVDDGQLDSSPLTFRDLHKIANAFIQILSGVFHERIEYPTIELHPAKELPKEVTAFIAEEKGEMPPPAHPADSPTQMEGDA